MDDVRLGASMRVIRTRKHLRQSDVARRSGVSREIVGRIERGGMGRYPIDMVRAVATTLGMRIDVVARWPGGDLDRVMNAGHAALHEVVAERLGGLPGWTWRPEVSFSIYGERGVIDILAWHAESRSLLIIELKTRLVDPQELASVMDRRVRLAERIAREQGWVPSSVSTWVIFSDTRTNHRRVLQHSGLLRAAFPSDGHSIRRWLSRPSGRISALSFWTHVASGALTSSRGHHRRVRRPAAATQPVTPERGWGRDRSD